MYEERKPLTPAQMAARKADEPAPREGAQGEVDVQSFPLVSWAKRQSPPVPRPSDAARSA